jgi:predicted glycoside hydrolase/deacetylase ChbG (UPF0249 family)
MKDTYTHTHKHTETYNTIFQVINELCTEQYRTTPRSPQPNRLQNINTAENLTIFNVTGTTDSGTQREYTKQ